MLATYATETPGRLSEIKKKIEEEKEDKEEYCEYQRGKCRDIGSCRHY